MKCAMFQGEIKLFADVSCWETSFVLSIYLNINRQIQKSATPHATLKRAAQNILIHLIITKKGCP